MRSSSKGHQEKDEIWITLAEFSFADLSIGIITERTSFTMGRCVCVLEREREKEREESMEIYFSFFLPRMKGNVMKILCLHLFFFLF